MSVLIESANELKSYIEDNNIDLWEGTPFEGYVFMSNKAKGSLGERLLENIWTKNGDTVVPPTNTGHDRIVNGVKREIKFSLAQTNRKIKEITNNLFMLNHISVGKDWDELYFYGINRDFSTVEILLTKESFKEIMNTPNQPYFKSQQGGNTINNDDWMCSGKNLIELYNSEFNMKELKEC